MQSLNNNFNVNRIERYLSLAWQSGGIPVIVLTKSDLVTNAQDYIDEGIHRELIGRFGLLASTDHLDYDKLK